MKFDNSGKGNLISIIVLFLILIGVIVGIIMFMNNIGMIDAKETFYPYLSKIPYIKNKINPKIETGSLLFEEQLKLKDKALKEKEKNIEALKKEIEENRQKLADKAAKLEQKEKDLLKQEQAYREKTRNQETEEIKLNRQAFYFENMKPVESAKKLAQLPDELVMKILKRIKNQKTVAVILMKMDDKKAGEILRKMSR